MDIGLPMPKQLIDNKDDIIGLIYQGITEVEPWKNLLRHLRVESESDVAAISLHPGNKGTPPVVIWDRFLPLAKSEINLAKKDHSLLIEQDPLKNALNRSGDIYTLEEVISRKALSKSDFYHKLMRPYGIDDQIGMCFSEPNGWTCNIGLMRSQSKPRFGKSEKDMLINLLPHLNEALRLYACIRHHEIEGAILRGALNQLGIGILILNRQSLIIDSNQKARSILKSTDSLSIKHQKLVSSQNKAALEKLINNAHYASEQNPRTNFVEAIQVKQSSNHNLGLLIRSVPNCSCLSGSSPSAIIYISDPQQDNIAHEQLIEKLFGLTKTEAMVTLLLCNGFTLAEIAIKLDVAENTARVYSKRIYSKVGVSRQAELIRLVLKSVAFLG